jgi:4-hydroxy-3-polyprenylbenzoate decarboxylase
VVFAAYGDKKRELCRDVPQALKELQGFEHAAIAMPGVVALQAKKFTNYETAKEEMEMLNAQCSMVNRQQSIVGSGVAIIVVCDDANFLSAALNNYLWVTYTRCNPSHDMYGIDSFTEHKHWGCNGPLVIDARIKPHHAPPVEKDAAVEKRIDRLFAKGGSLEGVA